MVFKEIKNEESREYITDTGFVYHIDNVKSLYISPSGTHYAIDAEGICHTLTKDSFMVCRFKGPVEFVNPSAN